MSERRTQAGDPVMADVARKLRSVWGEKAYIPQIIIEFAKYVADVVEKDWNYDFIPESMVVCLCEIKDYLQGKEGSEKQVSVKLPEELEKQKGAILDRLCFFTVVIDEIASHEFAKKFREFFCVVGAGKTPIKAE